MKLELNLQAIKNTNMKTVVGAVILTYLTLMGIALIIFIHSMFFSAVFWSIRLMMFAI